VAAICSAKVRTSLAQSTRVYDEYLEQVSVTGTDELEYYAVSVPGPR
jgi:hypothetical protein